jgi:2-methylcitrate dehydratase PrpD
MTNTDTVGPTARLANFVVNSASEPLSDAMVTRAAIALVDAFGLALAAKGNATMEAYVDLTQPLADPSRGATIWGRDGAVSVLDAVTANALSVHARFQDDCDMVSWAHPGSLIVPPSVSLGELEGASVETVLRAIVCGYAAITWLGGEEIVGRGVVGRGFRASPVFGSIGAAASASVILGLDFDQTRSALAISSDLTGGVLEPVGAGADDWRLQNAMAAHRGVMAALVAQRGVVGAPRALEGPNGLLHAFAGLDEIPEAWERDPDVTTMMDVWAKPYPTLGDNMAVTAAALDIHAQGVDPKDIVSIEVHQNAHFASYPGTSYRGPYQRPAQAMASTAFAVSATLLYGRMAYDIYRTNLDDSNVTGLIGLLSVVPEPEYSYVDGKVRVTLRDGNVFERSAAELPRTLFYRDEASAVEALKLILDETGYRSGLSRQIADAVFGSLADSSATSVATLVASLR